MSIINDDDLIMNTMSESSSTSLSDDILVQPESPPSTPKRWPTSSSSSFGSTVGETINNSHEFRSFLSSTGTLKRPTPRRPTAFAVYSPRSEGEASVERLEAIVKSEEDSEETEIILDAAWIRRERLRFCGADDNGTLGSLSSRFGFSRD